MNGLKIKLLDELMEHMRGRQGGGLKGLLDQSKKSMDPLGGALGEGSPLEEKSESPSEEAMEDKMGMGDKPKGISIEKVSVMGKPKIPGISMGRHHRIAAPGPKDGDLQSMIDKKTGGGMGVDPSHDGSEMSDDELKQLMSKYGM